MCVDLDIVSCSYKVAHIQPSTMGGVIFRCVPVIVVGSVKPAATAASQERVVRDRRQSQCISSTSQECAPRTAAHAGQ